MIHLTALDLIGLMTALPATAMFLGLLWVAILHWVRIDV